MAVRVTNPLARPRLVACRLGRWSMPLSDRSRGAAFGDHFSTTRPLFNRTFPEVVL